MNKNAALTKRAAKELFGLISAKLVERNAESVGKLDGIFNIAAARSFDIFD